METWVEMEVSSESSGDFHSDPRDGRVRQYLLSFNINFKLHLGLFLDFLPYLQFLSFSCPFPRPTCPSVPQPSFPWNRNVTDLPVFCLFSPFFFLFPEYSRAFSYWHRALLGSAMDICTLNLCRILDKKRTDWNAHRRFSSFRINASGLLRAYTNRSFYHVCCVLFLRCLSVRSQLTHHLLVRMK